MVDLVFAVSVNKISDDATTESLVLTVNGVSGRTLHQVSRRQNDQQFDRMKKKKKKKKKKTKRFLTEAGLPVAMATVSEKSE